MATRIRCRTALVALGATAALTLSCGGNDPGTGAADDQSSAAITDSLTTDTASGADGASSSASRAQVETGDSSSGRRSVLQNQQGNPTSAATNGGTAATSDQPATETRSAGATGQSSGPDSTVAGNTSSTRAPSSGAASNDSTGDQASPSNSQPVGNDSDSSTDAGTSSSDTGGQGPVGTIPSTAPVRPSSPPTTVAPPSSSMIDCSISLRPAGPASTSGAPFAVTVAGDKGLAWVVVSWTGGRQVAGISLAEDEPTTTFIQAGSPVGIRAEVYAEATLSPATLSCASEASS